ncbi:MAG TPA: acyl-CoA dehydrogenase family protein [Novosphingobium sp.]
MGWRVDNDLQQLLRESARGHLGAAGGAAHARQVRGLEQGFDPAAWQAFGELGWTGILLPERLGGAELGLEPALTLAEELGRALAPEPFVAAAIIAATVLAASVAPAAAALGAELATGARSVTLAWQEQRRTLGLPDFATRFEHGRLRGAKVHVPAWQAGTVLLVAAAGVDGPVVLAVDPAAPGLTARAERLSDGSMVADLEFDGVAIDEAAVLLAGPVARSALDLALDRGTIALSAQLEGLSGALWQVTADYIQQRVQFGSRLADFQALRHRMVDLFTQNELAAASWRAAAAALEQGGGARVAIHAAKARCAQAAQDMSRWAIQYHGAFGYTDEADVGLYVHAALAWSTWLGNPAAHRRAALLAHRNGTASHG